VGKSFCIFSTCGASGRNFQFFSSISVAHVRLIVLSFSKASQIGGKRDLRRKFPKSNGLGFRKIENSVDLGRDHVAAARGWSESRGHIKNLIHFPDWRTLEHYLGAKGWELGLEHAKDEYNCTMRECVWNAIRNHPLAIDKGLYVVSSSVKNLENPICVQLFLKKDLTIQGRAWRQGKTICRQPILRELLETEPTFCGPLLQMNPANLGQAWCHCGNTLRQRRSEKRHSAKCKQTQKKTHVYTHAHAHAHTHA